LTTVYFQELSKHTINENQIHTCGDVAVVLLVVLLF